MLKSNLQQIKTEINNDSTNMKQTQIVINHNSDLDSPSHRYLQEFGKNNNKNTKKRPILTQVDKDEIKNIIKNNFISRPFENFTISDKFLENEYNTVIKHVKNKHSCHMDSLYSFENYCRIKNIVFQQH
jgi:hypothetical protein